MDKKERERVIWEATAWLQLPSSEFTQAIFRMMD